MSGSLPSIFGRLARLTDRSADAAHRAVVRNLADTRGFAGLSHLPPLRPGDFERGRAALHGDLVLGGRHFSVEAATPWDDPLDPPFDHGLHAFDWLQDFAALGSKPARLRALAWSLGWLDRFADGSGPGWDAPVAARRLENLLSALPFLEPALTDQTGARLTDTLPLHLAYAMSCWTSEPLPDRRLKCLAGIVGAAACLKGFEAEEAEYSAILERQISEHLLPHGALSARNPAAALAVLEDLIRTRDVLLAAGKPRGGALMRGIDAMALTLRTVRHGDGSLARFHGGGAAGTARLDRALAQARTRRRPSEEPHMGFVRLHGGRVVAIMDCGRPPGGADAVSGHASTLSFEMSSGRRPVLVNVGPGATFGAAWARSPRTTAAHNTLALDKTSSSQLTPKGRDDRAGPALLMTRPSMVTVSQARDHTGMWLQARHDGYLQDYGLVHERRFFVSALGAEVHGEDVLLAPDQKSERRFQQRIKGAEKLGVALSLHFHLHPEVAVEHDPAAARLTLRLANGELWTFRQAGGLIELETSAYLDPEAPEPQRTRQIVVRARALTHNATLNWSLVRADSAAGPARRDV